MKCACGNEFYQWRTTQKFCPVCYYKIALGKKIAKRTTEAASGDVKNTKADTSATSTIFFNRAQKNGVKRKPSELTKAKKRAWLWFSRWIRLEHSKNGICFCYTCGKPHFIKDCDAGHFIGRGNAATMYHEDNSRPQGKKCNRFRQGEHTLFRAHLVEDIGRDAVEEIEALSRTRGDDSLLHHQSIEAIYKVKVLKLENERGEYFWK